MFLFGRKKGTEDWAELDEIVLNLDPRELEQVISFLQNVRRAFAQLPARRSIGTIGMTANCGARGSQI